MTYNKFEGLEIAPLFKTMKNPQTLMKSYRWWTEEELRILKNNYSTAREGLKDMEKLLPNRTAQAIRFRANKMGLFNPYKGRANYYDINFWEKYNKINSYWGGFVAADGCVTHTTNNGIAFAIGIHDKGHLEKIVKDTSADYKVAFKEKRTEKHQDMYSIRFYVCKKWEEDLKDNFNIVPRKTYNMDAPKQIPKEMFPYFLIGLIDGDGCWHLYKNKLGFSMTITLATKEILDFINEWAEENYPSKVGKSRKVRVDKKGHYRLAVCGAAACQMYLDLRELIPTRHLIRKWDCPIKIQYCKDYLSKHGHRLLPNHRILV